MKVIEFHPMLHQLAKQLGNARGVMNRNRLKKYDRGDKNSHVDYIGALGEIIFLQYLIEKNIPFEMVNMVDDTSSKKADFIVRGKRLDVKTKYNNHPQLILNLESHQKSKGFVDYYIFIQVQTETTANMHIFSWQEADTWKVMKMKYAPAKYLSI